MCGVGRSKAIFRDNRIMKKLIKWVFGFFLKKNNELALQKGRYKFFFVEDLPDNFKDDEIFIGGKIDSHWVVLMKCPCKCGDKIYLNTLQEEKPFWKLNVNDKNEIALSPSIWRTKNCESHFFIRNGQVEWAN
jgi:hypothetical protein